MSIRHTILLICTTFVIAYPGFLAAQTVQDSGVYLIAHRGGIVDDNHAENSRAAIRTAIERGYWMLEVDIRETKDGRAILQHDADFERYYNVPRRVSEMDWDEIKQLRSDIDGSRPILFSEAAELAAGNAAFMFDVKGNDFSDGFYHEIEAALLEHDVMKSTFILGGSQAKEYFYGRTSHSVGYNSLLQAAEAREPVSERYHLFELASNLTEGMIQKAEELGVTVVAAVNEFRYVQAGKDTWQGAREDINRLMELGVQHYQVDSVYEPLFNR